MYNPCIQKRRVLVPCVSFLSFPCVAPSVFRKLFVGRCASESFISVDVALTR